MHVQYVRNYVHYSLSADMMTFIQLITLNIHRQCCILAKDQWLLHCIYESFRHQSLLLCSCRRMLVQVSSKLSESHLEELKYLIEPEGIPLKDLEEATSGIKLFQLLEHRGAFSASSVCYAVLCNTYLLIFVSKELWSRVMGHGLSTCM